MNNYIKTLINANKDANANIAALEQTVSEYIITDEKTKVNYGNLCIALKGYRMVADATECMLINENCLKGNDGEFYQKINTNEEEQVQNAPTDKDCTSEVKGE